jgi:hypothetical protein
MVDQVRKLEMELASAQKRVLVLENALHGIKELATRGAQTGTKEMHSFALGRVLATAEFALDPNVLEGKHE